MKGRYVATIIFPDGMHVQATATGSPDDHTTGVLRMEAVSGMCDLLAESRIMEDDEVAEVAEALDRMDDE